VGDRTKFRPNDIQTNAPLTRPSFSGPTRKHRARNASTELVYIHLLKSVCMPALLYAVEVLPLIRTDNVMPNHLVDRAVCLIFACTNAQDVQFLRSVGYSQMSQRQTR